MTLTKISICLILSTLSSGCQIHYMMTSAYHQGKLLSQRKSIERVLENKDLHPTVREKLEIIDDIKKFASSELGFSSLKNYSSYVDLGRPHVSYIVTASPKNQVEAHLWWFPVVGNVPYKGYFHEAGAIKEEARLKKRDLDTYRRGVSAYSTLGWFRDPVMSSMTRMRLHHFVNLIFHELTHANLYIKSSVDFNEQVATFVGDIATEAFYSQREGPDSTTLLQIRRENHDTLIFSEFISKEVDELRGWYSDQSEVTEEARQERFNLIRQRFTSNVAPKLKTQLYVDFPLAEINNAFLQQNSIYLKDFAAFNLLFESKDKNLRKTFEYLKTLEKEKDPEETLRKKFEDLSPDSSSPEPET